MKVHAHNNDEVDASASGHPQPSSTILFHIFLLAGSQENIKKMSPQASSSPPIPASNHYGSQI